MCSRISLLENEAPLHVTPWGENMWQLVSGFFWTLAYAPFPLLILIRVFYFDEQQLWA